MQPEDFQHVYHAGDLQSYASTGAVTFTRTRANIERNRYDSELWAADLTTGELSAISQAPMATGSAGGEPQDSHLRHAPQFDTPAWLRKDARGHTQIWVAGRQVTRAPLGIQEFAWVAGSSQGDFHIIGICRAPEPGRYGTSPLSAPKRKLGSHEEAPRRFTGPIPRRNGLGFFTDRPTRVFSLRGRVVDGADNTAEPRMQFLDFGGLGHPGAEFSGLQVCGCGDFGFVTAARSADPIDQRRDLLRFELQTGSVENLTAKIDLQVQRFDVGAACCRPLFAAVPLGDGGRDYAGIAGGLYRWNGTEVSTVDADREVDYCPDRGRVSLSACGGSAYAQALVDGTVRLIRHDLREEENSTQRTLLGAPDEDVLDHVVVPELAGGDAGADDIVVACVGNQQSVSTIRVLQNAGKNQPKTSDLAGLASMQPINDPNLSGAVQVEYRTFQVSELSVPGLIAYPKQRETKPTPVILLIHGGPVSLFGRTLLDEIHVLAGAGYTVVAPNPRGSAGYGENWSRAIRGNFGDIDMHDVLGYLQSALAELDWVDSENVGIMGGSYGGYLTAWITGQDHRFRAAIVERAVLDPETFIGTSDIGESYISNYVGTGSSEWKRRSALRSADHCRTPTLVMHSQQDLRCPIWQAEHYYERLRRAEVPAEMLIFPGENHELSRSGQPVHRLQRFEAILEWWQRWL